MMIPTIRSGAPAALTLVSLLLLAGCCGTPNPPAPMAPAKAPVVASAMAGPLFDGKSLAGWEVTDFAGRGTVSVTNGEIRVGQGHMTGITLTRTNDLPRMNYEVSLDAMRVEGSDFFCGLTFPVGPSHCSFIVGGWGGGVVGLSNLNSEDASQNESTTYMNFASQKWYHIRVRVEAGKIQAWIDQDRVVNVETAEKGIGLRLEMESCIPLGVATWNTAAAWKNLQVKKL